jgi:hypothetical protein
MPQRWSSLASVPVAAQNIDATGGGVVALRFGYRRRLTATAFGNGPSGLRGVRRPRPLLAMSPILSALLVAGACVDPQAALAQDALWTGTTSGDWNTISNWSTGAVPLGTASFNSAGATKAIAFSSPSTSVGTMQFASAASDYTFTVFSFAGQTVSLGGQGIVGSSGNPVINVISGFNAVNLRFTNSSGLATRSE